MPGCRWLRSALVVLALPWAGAVDARPLVPSSDAQVVETLPLQLGQRREERRLRQAMEARPRDATLAVQAATQFMTMAREEGDARFAGLALGALAGWGRGSAATPTEVLVAKATALQFLHDFPGAAALLEQAVKQTPRQAQAWLTLATVRRVQGRLDASDAACQGVVASGQLIHGLACQAENQSLRGEADMARTLLQDLLARAAGAPGTALRQWLLTTLAETEERAGRPQDAATAWRAAMALGPHAYVQSAYADFLLSQDQPAEALALLKPLPLSDAVLLRLAIAGARTGDPQAARWRQEIAARLQASASRPGSAHAHAREQARFALEVSGQAARALVLARLNLRHQRESTDLLLMARVARAQPDAAVRAQALAELVALTQSMGVRDARLVEL